LKLRFGFVDVLRFVFDNGNVCPVTEVAAALEIVMAAIDGALAARAPLEIVTGCGLDLIATAVAANHIPNDFSH
jgi:hypothetical protein